MSIIIKSGASSSLANVNTDNELAIAPTQTVSKSGFVSLAGAVDAGSITGSRLARNINVSSSGRIQSGNDALLFNSIFMGTVINTATIRQTLTSFTVAQTTGFLRLNNGSSTTASQGALISTYRTFPVFAEYPITATTSLMLNENQNNTVTEIGFGLYSTAIAAVTDGAVFRIAGGVLRCVLINNSVEIPSASLTVPSLDVVNDYRIVVRQEEAEFWINDVLQARVSAGSAQDSVYATSHLPFCIRTWNSGTPTNATIVSVAEIEVTQNDLGGAISWPLQQAALGGGSFQAQAGSTQGLTANHVNSTVPSTGTPSNTAAGYSTLGGQFSIAAPASAETDLIMFAYTIPAPTLLLAGKNLVITGVNINTVNLGAAVATTATVLQWTLGVGSTAVTLATVEGAGTKIARRTSLGMQSFIVGDPIGRLGEPINIVFPTPIYCEAGSIVHIILKVLLGTATASQVLRGTVAVNGYFE